MRFQDLGQSAPGLKPFRDGCTGKARAESGMHQWREEDQRPDDAGGKAGDSGGRIAIMLRPAFQKGDQKTGGRDGGVDCECEDGQHVEVPPGTPRCKENTGEAPTPANRQKGLKLSGYRRITLDTAQFPLHIRGVGKSVFFGAEGASPHARYRHCEVSQDR